MRWNKVNYINRQVSDPIIVYSITGSPSSRLEKRLLFVIKFVELRCADIVSSVRVFKLDEINYINLGMSDPVIVYSMWFQSFKLDIILCVDTNKSFLKIKWYLNLNYFTFSMLFFLSPLDLKEVVLTDGSGYSSWESLETPAWRSIKKLFHFEIFN